MDDIKLEIGGGTNRYGLSTHVIDPYHPYSKFWTPLCPEEDYLKFFAQDSTWPFEDESVSSVYASHVLEHIPAGRDRIHVMNEAHRVLKRGGNFDILVPLVGYEDSFVGTWHAFADPTHVSYWWFPESLLYFCEGDFKPHADYGVKIWQLGSWHVNNGFEGVARLIKP